MLMDAPGTAQTDKRRYPRCPAPVLVRCHPIEESGLQVQSISRDISAAGIRFPAVEQLRGGGQFAVVEHADVDVPLVLADAELAADLDAVVRQPSALRGHDQGGRGEQSGRAVGLPGERIRDLAVVAVDRDRLDAELPGLDDELADLVHRRLLR